MSRRFSGSIFLLAMLCFALSLLAQGRAQSGLPGAKSIPDLSGIWEAPLELPSGDRPQVDICGEPSCAKLLGKPPMRDITLVEPQMLPWAEEKYMTAREGIQDPNSFGREEANPYFSACTPLAPPALMLATFNFFEIRQFPDVVLLLVGGLAGEADHTVRRIYLDGRGHPPDLRPTWMGHSTGRYEGDTLVVDTIGINDETWVDLQGHPHSDSLHLVERLRRVDQKSLEYEATIDDPKAYKNTWKKKIVRGLAPPGPRFWDDALCEELLQIGTHYSK